MNRLFVVGLTTVLLLSGCSSKLATVEGTVTWEDGTPISEALVVFTPKDGKGDAAHGATDTSGKFSLSTNGKSGTKPGDYDVTITKSSSKFDAKTTPEQAMKAMKETVKKPGGAAGMMGGPGMTGGGPKDSFGTYTKEELPAKYANQAKTPFQGVKVPGGTYTFKIEKEKEKAKK